MRPLVIVGDALLDRDVEGEVRRVAPDGPAPVLDERRTRIRPGGAALAAALAAVDGREVVLVTALADDPPGRELRALIAEAGVELVDLGTAAPTAEKIRLRSGGQLLARWDRGAQGPVEIGGFDGRARAVLEGASAVLVSCYGRGVTADAQVRRRIADTSRHCPVVWDPHPRGAPPTPGTTLVTPNASELQRLVPEVTGDGLESVVERADVLVRRWPVSAVVATLGVGGALLSTASGLPLAIPTEPASGDPCGAGDRFAASAAAALADGALVSEAVISAVGAASTFVATGGLAAAAVSLPTNGPGPDPRAAPPPETAALGAGDASDEEAFALAEDVRARGGTLVVTGGCFDLVHAGHVHLLAAARALGDRLIVCLNSDTSVRRLKGPGRPVVGQDDRARLLRALGCVDGVVVFDEDTPVPVLERLRPHVFAKGGDYGGVRIPEAQALARWGGQTVTLPYLAGRSTTRLLQEVQGDG